jgi:ABC-2 type transport system permease protein
MLNFKILFLNFIRSKGYVTALVLMLLASCLSLYIGKAFLEQHRQNVHQTAEYQAESIERYVKFHPHEMGLLLYYIKFGIVNEMPALAGLGIGQRDVNPSIVNVNIRNLEEQKYNSELHNPLFQLLGNFDFTFVLIYLFPLLIIAFCYNILSEEKEGGTWKMIQIQAQVPMKVLLIKLLIRLSTVLILLLTIFVLAKFYLDIPVDVPFLAYGSVSVMYVVFWFGLAWLIVSFQLNGKQNAIALLSLWIFLAILVPAFGNELLSLKFTTPESFETLLESRDGYHKKWDVEKEVTIENFYVQYPGLREYQHPEGQDFSWFWYYTMQHMGDVDAQEHVDALKQKLVQRNYWSGILGFFIPTIHTQNSLNRLGKSDLTNQILFWEAVEDFHEKNRLHFYPAVFSESPVHSEDWEKWNLVHYEEKSEVAFWELLLPYLLILALSILTSIISLRHDFSTKLN